MSSSYTNRSPTPQWFSGDALLDPSISCDWGGLITVIGIGSSKIRAFISRCSWQRAHGWRMQCTQHESQGASWEFSGNKCLEDAHAQSAQPLIETHHTIKSIIQIASTTLSVKILSRNPLGLERNAMLRNNIYNKACVTRRHIRKNNLLFNT